MKFGMRRRDRDAVGIEGVGNGEGDIPPQPTRGSGERRPKTNLMYIRRTRLVEGQEAQLLLRDLATFMSL